MGAMCAECGHPEWKHFGDGSRCENLNRNKSCGCPAYVKPCAHEHTTYPGPGLTVQCVDCGQRWS